MDETVNIQLLARRAIAGTEKWNLRGLTEKAVEGCRRRGRQANPPPEPNLTVRGPFGDCDSEGNHAPEKIR